ncbi:MAG TPA: 30S ribosomal protein S11 [Candidatus Paceibacterota bacterium]
MGKNKIVEENKEIKKTEPKKEGTVSAGSVSPVAKQPKKKINAGILYVQSTYNNTMCLLTDMKGNALAASSAGALGFKGAKKGTPFAAAKAGEALATKGQAMGLKEVSVVIKGVGSGRESVVRSFIAKGVGITGVKDVTPVPHNGPRPKKPRRV